MKGSPRPGPGQPATRRSRPGATPFRRAPARRVRRSAGANPPGEPARPGGGTGGRRAHRRRHQPGPGQAPAAGRRPARPGLQWPVAGLDPAARGARPGDHLRPARGDQHGPRRNAHARRLLHLRGATAVPAPGAGMAGALPVAGATGGVLRQRRHRHGPGAHGDPPSLRPAAGNPARHLGHQPGADPTGADAVRRAERRGSQPGLAVRRHPGAAEPGAAVEPHRHHRLRPVRAAPHLAAAEPHAARPERPRGDPEPQHGGLLRGAHRARGHARLRSRLGHRRARRGSPVAGRQRRPGPRPGLHHRLLPGGGARRRRPARRQRPRRLRPRRGEQDPRTADRRGAGQDPDPRADRPVHPETPAGTVRPERRVID